MPTNDDLNANAPDPIEPPEAPAAPTATPNVSLSRDDVRNMMRGVIDEVLTERASRQTSAAPVEPEPEDYTNDEIESLSPQQRSVVDKAVKKAVHGVRKEMAAFRDFGLARLGELTESSMRTQLPYYTKYEKEIQGELGRLNSALRTDPTTIRIVHDSVAMRHENERLEEARNEAIRKARGDAPPPSGNTSLRGAPPPKGVPTPEDLGFSTDQIDEINAKGGPDAFASRISGGRFTSWEAYTKAQKSLQSAPGRSGRKIITFARLEPKRNAVTNAA